jgi:hypothetical protein
MPARQTRQFLGYARIRRRAERILGKEKAGGSSPPVGSQFNNTVSLHLHVDFFFPEVPQGDALLQGVLYPNEVWQAIATGTHHVHRSGGTVSRDQSVRRVASGRSHGSGPLGRH